MKDELNYELLADVAQVIMGQSPPSSTYNAVGEGLPFYQGKTDFGDMYPTPRIYCTEPSRIAEAGDILSSVRAPVGPTNVSQERSCIGRGISAIRVGKNLDRDFLLYFLRFYEPELAKAGTGSTFTAISREDLETIKIPLPPLTEQKRIASLLARADRLRQLRRTAHDLGDALLQSVFLEMFGDPFRNEKGWERTEIREVAKIIVPTRDKPKRFSGDIPWVTLPDLDGLYVGNAKNLLTKEDAAEVGTRLMPANTVLLSCAGSLGKIAITTRPVYTNQQFYGLIANPDVLHYLFLASQLKMFGVEFYFNMAGMSTLGFFSRDKALDIEIILPPLSLQEEFAGVVARVESLRGRMGESTRQVEGLFESLLAQSFDSGR